MCDGWKTQEITRSNLEPALDCTATRFSQQTGHKSWSERSCSDRGRAGLRWLKCAVAAVLLMTAAGLFWSRKVLTRRSYIYINWHEEVLSIRQSRSQYQQVMVLSISPRGLRSFIQNQKIVSARRGAQYQEEEGLSISTRMCSVSGSPDSQSVRFSVSAWRFV